MTQDNRRIPMDRSLPRGYFKVRDYIRSRISREGLKVGDVLPSHKKMAAEIGINHITLRKALVLLEREGIVRLEARSGTYIQDPALGGGAAYMDAVDVPQHDGRSVQKLIAVHVSPQYMFWEPEAIPVYAPHVMQEKFTEAGYDLVLVDKVQAKHHYRPAGYVIVSPKQRLVGEVVEALDRSGAPYVLTHGHLGQTSYNVVDLDNYAAGSLVVEHLLDQGHERVAFIGGTHGHADDRYSAYIDCHFSHDLPVHREYCFRGIINRESADAAFSQFMQAAERPTAIVCPNDQIAAYVLDLCRSEGLGVPDDIAITGFDGRAIGEEEITTVPYRGAEIAAGAAGMLLNMIENKCNRAKSVMLEPELVVRGSSARRRRCDDSLCH